MNKNVINDNTQNTKFPFSLIVQELLERVALFYKINIVKLRDNIVYQ